MKLFKTNSRPNESEKIQFQNRSRKATDFSASNHQGDPNAMMVDIERELNPWQPICHGLE